MQALRNKLNMITRGLMFCEIDRFNCERMETTRTLVGSLIAANLQTTRLLSTKWEEVAGLSTLGMDEFAPNVKKIYELKEEDDLFDEV